MTTRQHTCTATATTTDGSVPPRCEACAAESMRRVTEAPFTDPNALTGTTAPPVRIDPLRSTVGSGGAPAGQTLTSPGGPMPTHGAGMPWLGQAVSAEPCPTCGVPTMTMTMTIGVTAGGHGGIPRQHCMWCSDARTIALRAEHASDTDVTARAAGFAAGLEAAANTADADAIIWDAEMRDAPNPKQRAYARAMAVAARSLGRSIRAIDGGGS